MAYLPDYEGHLVHLLGHSKHEDRTHYIKSYLSLRDKEPKKSKNILGLLYNNLQAKLLADWIEYRDVKEVRKTALIAARVKRASYTYNPAGGLAYAPYRMFSALVSNDPDIIHWFSWHVIPCLSGSKGRIPNYLQPQKTEFHAFNFHLALLGEFEWLAERTELALAEGVKFKSGKSYRLDYGFFKGLVNGSIGEMEDNIHQLLTGRVAFTRNNEHGLGYHRKVVSAWGVIFSKLAYRHGYELDIDSPWLPKEWLSMTPPVTTSDDKIFLESLELFSPLRGSSHYFENANYFSPVAPDSSQPDIKDWLENVIRAYP